MVLPDPGISLSRSLTYARTPGAATPMEMGLRLAGTDEFAGLDAAPDYRRADALWKIFKAVLPGLREPDAQTTRWMGRRPGTPDSLPVIGPSRTTANVWYGFGHGHMGLTWGPSTGRLIAELMTGCQEQHRPLALPGRPVLDDRKQPIEFESKFVPALSNTAEAPDTSGQITLISNQ
jgi:D-amino-acid dehydrogenase